MEVELVSEPAGLTGFVGGWDALCDEAAVPESSGSLLTAWYRHVMPDELEPRVWVATERGRVVGVLPLVAAPLGRGLQLSPPGQGAIYGAAPMAVPGQEPEVAAAIAGSLADGAEETSVLRLEGLSSGSPWSTAFDAVLGGSAFERVDSGELTASVVDLGDGIEAWWARRDREFRRRIRRRSRRLAEAGFARAVYRAPEDVVSHLDVVRSLYLQRKAERGGRGYDFDERFAAMLGEVASASPSRLALVTVEGNEQVIAVQLVLQAGRCALEWLTAFDAAWGSLGPGIEVMVAGIEASAPTHETVSLSVGDFGYKAELRDRAVPSISVAWCRPRYRRLMFAFEAAE